MKLLLPLFALFSLPAFAQLTELTGLITDPSGQPIPAASVTVTRTGANVLTRTTSNDIGYFFFPNLAPGMYEIDIQKSGFKALKRSNISLSTADRARVDFRLEIGAVNEVVTVTDQISLLQISSAEQTTTVTTREYERLPQIQFNRPRNPTQFLYLSPGVTGQVNNNGNDSTSASTQMQVHGGGKFYNEIYFEGLPGRSNFTETAPPVEALSEFKLQANQISAEYGNTGSAVVTFTAKSGTNQYRGQASNILRNQVLDARSFFAPSRPPLRQNEFSATLGGPILIPKLYNGKNRSFFFFGYSGSRKFGADQFVRQRVATPAERAGDFSALRTAAGQLNPIYDPQTTRQGPNGFLRDPFPGNIIPSQRIDPVAAKVAALLPAPNLTGAGAFNYAAFIGERRLDPNLYVTKIDHAFTERHKINGSYVYTAYPRENIGAGQLISDPFSGLTFQYIRSHMVRGNYDWVLKPNLLNTLTTGFNRFKEPNGSLFAGRGLAAQLGLRNTEGDASPAFSFSDGFTALGTSGNFLSYEQAFLLRNTTSYTRGRHSIKFGGEFRQNLRSRIDDGNSAGSYAFNNLGTALPVSPQNTGNGFASFLLGQVASASIAIPFQQATRRPYLGFFVQDDFRLTSRLTLNIGFRYEANLAPYDLENKYSFIDLALPNPAAGNRPGAAIFAGSGEGRTGSSKLLPGDFSGIGPRFGFAWSLNAKTVLRGGYGIYYADNGFFPINANQGFAIRPSFATVNAGVTPAFLLSAGIPQNFNRQPVLNPSALNNQSVNAINDTISRSPRTQNWSFGIQRELSANWAAELSYVGSNNTRQVAPTLVNENQLHPRYLALGTLLTQPITSAAAVAAGIPRPYPTFNGSVAQALRAFPQFLTVSEPLAKAGHTTYHAASIRLHKRYQSGLTLDTHYTWARNLGYSESSGFLPGNVGFGTTSNILQDNFNRQLEWSLLPSDIPHALVLNYSYELPFGPGKRIFRTDNWARYITAGWTLAGIQRYMTGQPLSVFVNNTLPAFNRILRPNAIPGASRSTGISLGDFQPSTDRRISPQAYAFPAPFTFGTAAPTYNDVRNFPYLQEDFSIIKNTQFTERFSVEFLGQIINAFNRHRFSTIDANFSNPQFGRPAASNNGRIITLGLRLRY
jgi:hypothetical protein